MNKPKTAEFLSIAETGPYTWEKVNQGTEIGIFLADSDTPGGSCWTLAEAYEKAQGCCREISAQLFAFTDQTYAQYIAGGGKA